MPTPREEILAGPNDLSKLEGAVKLNALFANFCQYGTYTAKWSYVGTGTVGGKPIAADDILNGTSMGKVYCEPLVYAFIALAREVLGTGMLPVKLVQHPPCILKPGYTCIDPSVVGSVRTKSGTYGSQKQCFFSAKHVYCQIGGTYYDPCFARTYAKEGEPILSEDFIQPDARKWPLIQHLRVTGIPKLIILKKISTESPRGFDVGWLLLDPEDMGTNELAQFDDFAKEKLKIYGIGRRK